MIPERTDIPAPMLPDGLPWIGQPPHSMAALTARGPALVHFFDFAQLNSVRALPYVVEWDRRYRDAGLSTIGVQAPRFAFGADPAVVAPALEALEVAFPVAIDSERALWHAYGCEGWPSLFLWRRGGALGWFHFGEGEYTATERAIQAELATLGGSVEAPAPLPPLRPTDAADALVMPPTAECFPGGSWERPWTAGEDGEALELDYEAGGAYATVEGGGELAIELDGAASEPIEVSGPRLYALAEHVRHEAHSITLHPAPGLRIWSVSFAPGVP